MVWEQELYNDMEYLASTDFLHTFEGEVIKKIVFGKECSVIYFIRSTWLALILQVWMRLGI